MVVNCDKLITQGRYDNNKISRKDNFEHLNYIFNIAVL